MALVSIPLPHRATSMVLVILIAWSSMVPPLACTAAKIVKSQEAALLSLKAGSAVYTTTESWKAGNDCSQWDGVTCTSSGQVIAVDITTISYSTPIPTSLPSQIGDLVSLRSLKMSVDNVNSLPNEICNLQLLTELSISDHLSKPLPSCISSLQRLQSLNFGRNSLSGAFPPVLLALTSLTSLLLYSNKFSGAIPTKIYQLSRLGKLDLSFNQFSGRIPSTLSAFPSLAYINLAGNKLSGAVPTELARLTRLAYLDFGSNSFSGVIPSEFGALRLLTTISLEYNRLTGLIPSSFSTLQKLVELRLGNNQLVGLLPVDLLNSLTSAHLLDLSGNGFTGSVPSLPNLKKLTHLDLAENLLTGQVSDSVFSNKPELMSITLSSNKLSGRFPWKATKAAKALEWIHLDNNSFVGYIPADTFLNTSLYSLDIRQNFFTGSLPSIGDGQSEFGVHVDDNYFFGSAAFYVGGRGTLCATGERFSGDHNCFAKTRTCTPSKPRSAQQCRNFCGLTSTKGACSGGLGTCVPSGSGKFECVCARGYERVPGRTDACRRKSRS